VAFAFLASDRRSDYALFAERDYARQRAYFSAHPELAPTPLLHLPALAHELGLAGISIKDETARFGLNAFKTAGARFAVDVLREDGVVRAGDTLVCASEGNHGRAVARAAREANCRARVYMAASAAASRIAAIEGEGASVVLVDGTYDDALRLMAKEAGAHGWQVISDTALEGEPVDVPRLIMLGYTRVMDEARAQWRFSGTPDAVFVPGGVGGLLGAVADWTRAAQERPRVVCVEPVSAACLQISAREGRPTTVAGPFHTAMAGLRCGEVSRASFESVRAGVEAYIAVEDSWAFDAMRLLATGTGSDPTVRAGASGTAALGGLLATMRDSGLADVRAALGLTGSARVMALVTEGVTDPDLFAAVVGRPTNEQAGAERMEP
jgi:diaminopropionate ammonia-lyase